MKNKTLCIQTELSKLIDDINMDFPNIKLENYKVINPYNFTDDIIV